MAVGGHVGPLGGSPLTCGGEDVPVRSRDGPDGLFRVAVSGAWGLSPHWGRVHVHGGGLIQAVHVALHLVQETLLLSLGDTAETDS